MRAMLLKALTDVERDAAPLELVDLPVPQPRQGQLLVEISACAVCHTELDEIEGRTPPPRLPVVPGHQVVGRVAALGPGTGRYQVGDRVGIAWIHSACGHCEYCLAGEENLCPAFRATGRDVDGGYAEYMTVSQEYAYRIPACFSDLQAAPLLCAGAVGYRALRLSGLQDGQCLGLTGFGASAHLVLPMVRQRFPGARVSVFARSESERAFARELGAVWAGDTTDTAPEPLHCIIDTTPAWTPVVEALRNLRPGGRLVINAIRKQETDKQTLQRLDYQVHLWMEKELKSVANVARRDVEEFLQLAAEIPLQPQLQVFPLEQANQALIEVKRGRIRGAKVLSIR